MSKGALIYSFNDTYPIARKVSNILKCDSSLISSKSFPDGELLIRLHENPSNRDVFIISSMALNPEKRMIETYLAAGAARDHGARRVILLATYMPYLRQDKSFNNYESISAKHVMSMMVSIFDKVLVIDPHLHRINSLKEYSSKAGEISSNKIVADFLKKMKGDFTIIGPDEESDQWTKDIAKLLGKKVHVLIKNRSSSYNVKVSGDNFKLTENVVVIDDIISTGNTISESLKLIKKRGAKKITCIGIHGILAGDAAKKITKYARLITTNTIPSKYSKIDISPLLAEKIKEEI